MNHFIPMIISRLSYHHPDRQIRPVFFVAAFAVMAFLSNFSTASQPRKLSASPILKALEESIPQNAILITHSDHDTYAMWYLQNVEKKRNDVLVVAANFMRYDWYQEMLPREGQDALGRYVKVAPGSFRDFTAQDQYNMISDNIITPNIDSVPIVISNTDALMVEMTSASWSLDVTEVLIAEELTMLQYIDQHYAAPPTALYQITRPIAPTP